MGKKKNKSLNPVDKPNVEQSTAGQSTSGQSNTSRSREQASNSEGNTSNSTNKNRKKNSSNQVDSTVQSSKSDQSSSSYVLRVRTTPDKKKSGKKSSTQNRTSAGKAPGNRESLVHHALWAYLDYLLRNISDADMIALQARFLEIIQQFLDQQK